MSLSTSMIADMRAAFANSPMATTVSLTIKTADAFGSPQTVAAIVSTYKKGEAFNQFGRSQKLTEAILVRPIADPTGTVKLGDRVAYNSQNYTIVELQNTAISGWVCERSERIGVNRDDTFRAEGGGS